MYRKAVVLVALIVCVGCMTPALVDEVQAIRQIEAQVAQLRAELGATAGISETRRKNAEAALNLAAAELVEADNLHSIAGVAEPPHDKIAALVEVAKTRCAAIRFGLSR